MGQRTHLQWLSSSALSNCCPTAARWPELIEPAPVDSAVNESSTEDCLDLPSCARPLSFLLLGLTAPAQVACQSCCPAKEGSPLCNALNAGTAASIGVKQGALNHCQTHVSGASDLQKMGSVSIPSLHLSNHLRLHASECTQAEL